MIQFSDRLLKDVGLRHLGRTLVVASAVFLLGSCQGTSTTGSGAVKDSAVNAAVPAQPSGQKTVASAPTFTGDTLSLHVKAVELPVTEKNSDTLWGYEIYTGDKLYIKQYNVPGVAGQNGFTSKADAEKIAEMVSHKLKTHQIPSISQQELSEAKVTYKSYQ
ncbi:protein of unknown function [Arachidicoccus rhizosphaerae]|uniref:DUF4907 domain-containing protein n=1 Tax=Arachidicoccus rhizosphaerae TaxID=551991 RepID=A0A1H3XVD6_9BACT|nr:DUF4907 domain-containing protein [Arachidicoccus rhizosphaerae]SEA03273.1 protein of unknown function [Arachidicoccus rhizosphaerae]